MGGFAASKASRGIAELGAAAAASYLAGVGASSHSPTGITVGGAGRTGGIWTSNPVTGADATEDVLYSGTITGSATDGDPLTYGKVSGPGWLVVGSEGTLSGTPGNGGAGADVFTVSVTNANIATPVEATLNITVRTPSTTEVIKESFSDSDSTLNGNTPGIGLRNLRHREGSRDALPPGHRSGAGFAGSSRGRISEPGRWFF